MEITTNVLGAALVLLAAGAIGGSVYAIARLFLVPDGGGRSTLDEYLRSGAANPNPSHIPPSYSGDFRRHAEGRHATHAQIAVLDDPATQRRKFEASQTTTTRELRNIE